MTERNFKNRTLYHGDNLDFLRGMNSETVNLIATDPPFNKSKNNGIILRRDYGALETTKPDGLVLYQRWVRAMVEYKQSRELRARQDIDKAINQEVDVAKALCKILIVTDSAKSFWVNALNGDLPRKRRIRRQNDTGRSLS